jgi:hypothetical protein
MTDFIGMSRSQCPAGCKLERCLITETASCGHPCMTGIQHALKSKPGVLDRYADACRAIGARNVHEVVQR